MFPYTMHDEQIVRRHSFSENLSLKNAYLFKTRASISMDWAKAIRSTSITKFTTCYKLGVALWPQNALYTNHTQK